MVDTLIGTATSMAPGHHKIVSDLTAVADSVVLTDQVPEHLTHCFVGVHQFDTNGDPAVAGAGSYAIQVQTQPNGQGLDDQWEDVSGTPIDATAPVTLNFAAAVKAIRAVPTGITTVTHYQLVLTMHES